MPKLRTLSGSDVLSILSEFNFRPISQRGSHIKLPGSLRNLIFAASSSLNNCAEPERGRVN